MGLPEGRGLTQGESFRSRAGFPAPPMKRSVQLFVLTGCVIAALAVVWWMTSVTLRHRESARPMEERVRPLEPPPATASYRPELDEGSVPSLRTEERDPASVGPPARVTVLVRSKGDHFPLEGWRMQLVDNGGPESKSEVQVRGLDGSGGLTDAKGHVELLAPSNHKLVLIGWDDHGKQEDASFEIAPLAENENRSMTVEFAISTDLYLHFRILAREDRSPIEGAHIYVLLNANLGEMRSDRALPIEQRPPDAISDRLGIAELWAPAWAQAGLELRATGYGPVRIGPKDDAPDITREVLLDRSATVRVRVIESKSGLPMDEAHVELSADPSAIRQPLQGGSVLAQNNDPLSWSADTRTTGECRLDDLPPKVALRVRVGRKGEVGRRLDAPVTLDPGETRDVEYRLGGLCRISGQISDVHGGAVPGVAVCAERARIDSRTYSKPTTGEGCSAEAQSDGLGHYELPPLPVGRWWIGPKSVLALKSADGKLSMLLPVIAEVVDGTDSLTVDLEVRDALFISGRVLDSSGSGAFSSVVVSSLETSLSDHDLTQQDGTFSVGPLLPGPYRVRAKALGGVEAKLDSVQAGASDVVIQLPASSKLSGVVVDAATRRPCIARVLASAKGKLDAKQFATDDAGRFKTPGLESGEWVLSAYTDDGRFGGGYETKISADEEGDPIEIEVYPAGRIRVQIEGGTKVGGIFVESGGAMVNMSAGQPGETVEMIVPLADLSIRCDVDGRRRIANTRVERAGDVADVVLK